MRRTTYESSTLKNFLNIRVLTVHNLYLAKKAVSLEQSCFSVSRLLKVGARYLKLEIKAKLKTSCQFACFGLYLKL